MAVTTHTRNTHASTDIKHIVLNFWTGRMGVVVPASIGSILTVAAAPGLVPDGVRHRHTPINEHTLDPDRIRSVVDWVMSQWHSDRAVLVRSEDGNHRPNLIVALALMNLGAHAADALRCLERSDCPALPQPYLDLLIAEETHG